jgi:hypothetical protein
MDKLSEGYRAGAAKPDDCDMKSAKNTLACFTQSQALPVKPVLLNAAGVVG